MKNLAPAGEYEAPQSFMRVQEFLDFQSAPHPLRRQLFHCTLHQVKFLSVGKKVVALAVMIFPVVNPYFAFANHFELISVDDDRFAFINANA